MPADNHETPGSNDASQPTLLSSTLNRAIDKVLEFLRADGQSAPTSSPQAEQPAAWIAPVEGAQEQLGRIMLSWPAAARAPFGMIDHLAGVFFSQHLNSSVALVTGHAANDNTFWVGDEDFDGEGGFIGRDPTAAVLADGHTVVAWISEDNIVHAKVYPPEAAALARQYSHDTASRSLSGTHLTLGEAAPPSSRSNVRLAVSPNDENGFMAIWITASGFTAALIAKASIGSVPSEPGEDATSATHWHAIDLPPIPAPIQPVDPAVVAQADHDVQVAPETHEEEHTAAHEAGTADAPSPQHNEAHAAPQADHHEAVHPGAGSHWVFGLHHTAAGDGEFATPESIQTAAAAKVDATPAVTDSDTSEQTDAVTIPAQPLTDDGLAIPLPPAEPVVPHTVPPKTVVNHATGTSHVLNVDQGDGPSTITVTSYDSDGQPIVHSDGTPVTIVITENAIVSDPNAPALDLAPDIAVVRGEVAVAFVEHQPESDNIQLSLAVVDPEADVPAVQMAAVSAGGSPADTISDISLASTDGQSCTADLAILWVINADSRGYGNVTAQLADITQSSPSEGDAAAATPVPDIVLLGRDGENDGNDDAFTLGTGRDPHAASVSGDALAVAWIAPPSDTGGEASIKGAILSLDGGELLQDIDLTSAVPSGADSVSDLSVGSDSAGDIVLSWLQAAIDGGFNAFAAWYERSSASSWDEPSHSKFLKHFADKPLQIVFTVDEDNSLNVTLAWSDHGGQNYNDTIALTSGDLADLVSGTDGSSPPGPSLAGPADDHSGSSGPGSDGSSSGHGSDGNLGAAPDASHEIASTITPSILDDARADHQDSNSGSNSSGSSSGPGSSGGDDGSSSHSGIDNSGSDNSGSDNSGSGSSGSGGGNNDQSATSDSVPPAPSLDALTSQASVTTFAITVDFANDTIYLPASLTGNAGALQSNQGAAPEVSSSGHGPGQGVADDAIQQHDLIISSGHDDQSGKGTSGKSGHDDDHEDDGQGGKDHDEDKHGGGGDHDDNGHLSDVFVFHSGFGSDASVPDLVLDDSGHLKDDIFAPAFALDFGLAATEDVLVFDHSGAVTQFTSTTLADLAWI